MAQCDYPIAVQLKQPLIDKKGGYVYNAKVRCGKCYNCRKERKSSWSYRMTKQLEVSDNAFFITLTYDTANVPITEKGFMTLNKKDVQDFNKLLRYYENEDYKKGKVTPELFRLGYRGNKALQERKKYTYFAAGEYGSKGSRPHIHLIVYNLYNKENILNAWKKGSVHIDEANVNTIDYTLKYIMKEQTKNKFANFDGIPEFVMMSKGIGEHIKGKKEVKDYFKKNLEINYLVNDRGYKIPMPKYYRKDILNNEEKQRQLKHIILEDKKKEEKEREIARKKGYSYDEKQVHEKRARQAKMRSQKNQNSQTDKI